MHITSIGPDFFSLISSIIKSLSFISMFDSEIGHKWLLEGLLGWSGILELLIISLLCPAGRQFCDSPSYLTKFVCAWFSNILRSGFVGQPSLESVGTSSLRTIQPTHSEAVKCYSWPFDWSEAQKGSEESKEEGHLKIQNSAHSTSERHYYLPARTCWSVWLWLLLQELAWKWIPTACKPGKSETCNNHKKRQN